MGRIPSCNTTNQSVIIPRLRGFTDAISTALSMNFLFAMSKDAASCLLLSAQASQLPLLLKITQAIKTHTADSLTKAGMNSLCDTQRNPPPSRNCFKVFPTMQKDKREEDVGIGGYVKGETAFCYEHKKKPLTIPSQLQQPADQSADQAGQTVAQSVTVMVVMVMLRCHLSCHQLNFALIL